MATFVRGYQSLFEYAVKKAKRIELITGSVSLVFEAFFREDQAPMITVTRLIIFA